MEETYATFDTFTVGEKFAPGEDPLAPPPQAPILARLPRLGTAKSVVGNPQKNNRFDQPEKGIIGVHAPEEAAPEAAPLIQGADNPASTIRFDTLLTEEGFIEEKGIEAKRVGVEAVRVGTNRPQSVRNEAPQLQPTTEFDSWLLNLEAAVMPYSRWIVLAAVISALGLALVLLRGSAPAALGDALLPGDRVENTVSNSATVAVDETDSVPAVRTLDTGTLGTGKGLLPMDSSPEAITNTLATTAMGPAAHKTNNAPQARLAQQVQPIEPYRVTGTAERIEIASQRSVGGYPRTAANGPLAPVTSERSTLR